MRVLSPVDQAEDVISRARAQEMLDAVPVSPLQPQLDALRTTAAAGTMSYEDMVLGVRLLIQIVGSSAYPELEALRAKASAGTLSYDEMVSAVRHLVLAKTS